MTWLWRILSRVFETFRQSYQHIYCEDLPELVKQKTIYIVGDKAYPWLLVFKCPCGCKQLIQLNLLRDTRPFWKFRLARNNKLTISPSIWRKVGCKSHFYVTNSKITWV